MEPSTEDDPFTFNRSYASRTLDGSPTHTSLPEMVESMTDFRKPCSYFSKQRSTLLLTVEVAFHYILYLRGIYPRETFSRKKMYGVPVWQNRHPLVKGYIAGLLQSVTREMKRVRPHRWFLIALSIG